MFKIMKEFKNRLINDRLSNYEGQMFLIHSHENKQDVSDLVNEVSNVIAKHNLSVTVAKGFLEYMKIVIDDYSYIQCKDKEAFKIE